MSKPNPKKRKPCDHKRGNDAHAFQWPDFINRNIWNPLHPVCSKCTKSIGELLGFYRRARR